MKTRIQLAAFGILLAASIVSAEPPKANTVRIFVHDLDLDQSVANSSIQVVVNSNCESGGQILRFSASTNEYGQFETSLPVDLRFTTSEGAQRVKLLKWRCEGQDELAATTE